MWSSFAGDTLYLDTNILIFSVEQGNPWSEMLRELFEEIDGRVIHALTSELTIAEVLVKPIALGEDDLIETYNQLLAANSIIRTVPIDRPILGLAAELQSRLGIRLMDAIHVATAKVCACEFFLTNDEPLGRKIEPELRWIQLSEVGQERL
jgi:uncharacterized protein